jgi:hypothetical protein
MTSVNITKESFFFDLRLHYMWPWNQQAVALAAFVALTIDAKL